MSFIIGQFREVNYFSQKLAQDPIIGCKPPYNLVELIENDLKLEEGSSNDMKLWTYKMLEDFYFHFLLFLPFIA